MGTGRLRSFNKLCPEDIGKPHASGDRTLLLETGRLVRQCNGIPRTVSINLIRDTCSTRAPGPGRSGSHGRGASLNDKQIAISNMSHLSHLRILKAGVKL